MAIVARRHEYGEDSMDAAGGLDYFQQKMAFRTGPIELSRAIQRRTR